MRGGSEFIFSSEKEMDERLEFWTVPWAECLDERNRVRTSVKVPLCYGLLLGAPRSGKTHLIKHLYEKYWSKIYDIVFFFSISEDMSSAFSDAIRDVKVKNPDRKDYAGKWDGGVRMRKLREINKTRTQEGSRPLYSMVVLDDVFQDEKNDQSVAISFLQGRHSFQACLYASQRFRLLPTAARSTFDWIAIGAPPNSQEEVTELLREYFTLRWDASEMGGGDKRVRVQSRSLQRYLIDNTRDHSFLVLIPAEGYEWYDSVKKYRA